MQPLLLKDVTDRAEKLLILLAQKLADGLEAGLDTADLEARQGLTQGLLAQAVTATSPEALRLLLAFIVQLEELSGLATGPFPSLLEPPAAESLLARVRLLQAALARQLVSAREQGQDPGPLECRIATLTGLELQLSQQPGPEQLRLLAALLEQFAGLSGIHISPFQALHQPLLVRRTGAGNTHWLDIQGRPLQFTPAPHLHEPSEIRGFTAAVQAIFASAGDRLLSGGKTRVEGDEVIVEPLRYQLAGIAYELTEETRLPFTLATAPLRMIASLRALAGGQLLLRYGAQAVSPTAPAPAQGELEISFLFISEAGAVAVDIEPDPRLHAQNTDTQLMAGATPVTAQQLLGLLEKEDPQVSFASLTGQVEDNAALLEALAGKEDTANKGEPGGYASLDNAGKVPLAQLPDIDGLPSGGTAADVLKGDKSWTNFASWVSSVMQATIDGVNTAIGLKQDTLVSGTNIKTVNGESLLGGGNIQVQAGEVTKAAVEAVLTGNITSHTHTTDQVTEGTNKYFTEARVRDTIISTLSTLVSGIPLATDSIITAISKLTKIVSAPTLNEYQIYFTDAGTLKGERASDVAVKMTKIIRSAEVLTVRYTLLPGGSEQLVTFPTTGDTLTANVNINRTAGQRVDWRITASTWTGNPNITIITETT
jgi:hypothetical protein